MTTIDENINSLYKQGDISSSYVVNGIVLGYCKKSWLAICLGEKNYLNVNWMTLK